VATFSEWGRSKCQFGRRIPKSDYFLPWPRCPQRLFSFGQYLNYLCAANILCFVIVNASCGVRYFLSSIIGGYVTSCYDNSLVNKTLLTNNNVSGDCPDNYYVGNIYAACSGSWAGVRYVASHIRLQYWRVASTVLLLYWNSLWRRLAHVRWSI
jgi:hypothetical protein